MKSSFEIKLRDILIILLGIGIAYFALFTITTIVGFYIWIDVWPSWRDSFVEHDSYLVNRTDNHWDWIQNLDERMKRIEIMEGLRYD